MDPFTQRMLERTKQRHERLEQYFAKEPGLGLRQPLQEKNNLNPSSFEENMRKENYKIDDLKSQTNTNSDYEYSENVLFKYNDQNNLKSQLTDELEDDVRQSAPKNRKYGRLAELATRIKEWEDEVDRPKQNTCATAASKVNEKKSVPLRDFGAKNNKLIQEDKTHDKQESQGYTLSQNESRLIYDFAEDKKDAKTKNQEPAPEDISSPSKKVNFRELSKTEDPGKKNNNNIMKVKNETGKDSTVLKKAAFFESKSSPVKPGKDPVELSISERKALFEKNGGEALIPKVAFATPLPAKFIPSNQKKIPQEKSSDKVKMETEPLSVKKVINNPSNQRKIEPSDAPLRKPMRLTGLFENDNKVKSQKEKFEKGLFSSKEVVSPKENPDILKREKELELLKNRWDHNKNVSSKIQAVPEPPPMPETLNSPQNEPERKIEAENTSGLSNRLYPSLSDFEESDGNEQQTSDSDSVNESKSSNLYLNMSFSDILEAKKNDPTSSNENSFNDDTRESQVLNKMDEYLDNALNELSSTDNEYDSDNETNPSPPKMLKSSSFEYKNNAADDSGPLVHTVSFYRKQQQYSTNNQTPTSVKSVKREENVVVNVVEVEEQILVENKIQDLLQEINKQQTIISQASQALNLCLSTVEFSNSGEQVESERLLLLANHKRQACLNEIQRLKVENTIRPLGSNQQITEKGDVIIKNIAIPLKRDALRSMAAVESMQYLVCLIKSDERVVATPAIPASRDNLMNMVLCFPGQYKLEKLFSDFKVTIEVYNLELSKEMLPHEIKYHIAGKKDKKLLTPIKSKKSESKLVMPYIQSPAGPNAVRSSNFHLCGYVVFSLREVSRTNWRLNKVPYTSPLEGSFSMKIESQLQLDQEFRGFLTMFDDISGFGAWHRRWCLLSSHTLSYWKYPDDESRKVPIGTIDLRSVITENIGIVSRDICARLYTFLLETTRPREPDDKESLVLNVQGDTTKIRHLLSADSKEEMLLWCNKLNTTLALLRSWKCNFDA